MALLLMLCIATEAQEKRREMKPWEHGRLRVSDNQRFLQHEDGEPFFWLGETAWLMPQRLNRDEVQYYLQMCHEAEYNMVQVQVMNEVPSYNAYGQKSLTVDAATGRFTFLGEHDSKVCTFRPHKTIDGIEDGVLIAVDASKNYLMN